MAGDQLPRKATDRLPEPSGGTRLHTHAFEPQPQILVVEDDDTLRGALVFNLERNGYRVIEAADGYDALDKARAHAPDLILLDVMLPKLDGRQVCRAIRQDSGVPILMLTALDREMDVVNSFELGADDYVSKPFSVKELLARISALLRRGAPRGAHEDVLSAGALTIFLREHRVVFYERELYLPLKEFRLLAALVGHAGQVFTRPELIDIVWGKGIVIDPRNVDVRVRWLRERLAGDPDGSKLIQTVHGVGYRFAG